MFFEMTYQIRVSDIAKGKKWYSTFFQREPDFIPHEGFAEWEILPGCWLQVAEGSPSKGSGPLRLAVKDIIFEQNRLRSELEIVDFQIEGREEVPVRWGTFQDPWENQIGLFEYNDKEEERERMMAILRKQL
ncbi:MAG: VOC family protein [Niallia sp.]